MDTRDKIISAAEARIRLTDGDWLVIAGYFDPLTAALAEHVHHLAEQGRRERVLAIVLREGETLLTAEARSILTAALREIDAVVVMPESEVRQFLPAETRVRFVFDKEEERRHTEAFTTVVLTRGRLAARPAERGS